MPTYYINGSTSPYVGSQGTYGAGNDTTGNGTLAAPWKTVGKFVASASANDTGYIAAGTYAESIVDTKGLVFTADGEVIISAQSATAYATSAGTPVLNNLILDGGSTVSDYGVNITAGTGKRTFNNVSIRNLKVSGIGVLRGSAAEIEFNQGTISGSNLIAACFQLNDTGTANITVTETTITAKANRIFLDSDSLGTKTFRNLNVSAEMPLYAYNLFAKGPVVIDGGTYNFTGSATSFIRLANGVGSGELTVLNSPSVTYNGIATSAPVVNVTAGAHPIDISMDITARSAAQNKDLIYIANQPAPVVHDCIFDTRGFIGDISNKCYHVQIVSTGTVVGAARIHHNTSYSTANYGNVYLIGNDISGTGDGKCTGGEIDHNNIYGSLYYDNTITTCGLHGAEIAWSGAGKIHHNFITGCAYGPVIKWGGGDYAGANGIYTNLLVDNGGTGATSAQACIIVKGAQNVPVYNNTAVLTTGLKCQFGLIHLYTNNDSATHLAASAVIKNNILVADSSIQTIYIGTSGDALDAPTYTINNNLHYSYGGAFNSFIGPATTYPNFATWQGVGDAAGIFANPLFSGVGSYSLQSLSSAINAGVDLSLGEDYAGNPVYGNPIGAYSYQYNRSIAPITSPGPLGIDATVVSGTTLADAVIQAPLGPKFQVGPCANNASVTLNLLTPTSKLFIGTKAFLVYGDDLSAANAARATRYVGPAL